MQLYWNNPTRGQQRRDFAEIPFKWMNEWMNKKIHLTAAPSPSGLTKRRCGYSPAMGWHTVEVKLPVRGEISERTCSSPTHCHWLAKTVPEWNNNPAHRPMNSRMWQVWTVDSDSVSPSSTFPTFGSSFTTAFILPRFSLYSLRCVTVLAAWTS